MAYKKFELEDPKLQKRWNRYMWVKPVEPRLHTVEKGFKPGLSMIQRPNGARALRLKIVNLTPEKFIPTDIQPKHSILIDVGMFGMTKTQLRAAHIKFLSREGWTVERIIERIDAVPGTVYNILSRRTHREVLPLKPDWFEKNT